MTTDTDMTATETRPTDDAAATGPGEAPPALELDVPPGIAGVFGTGDHKAIGRLFIGFSLLFGIVSLLAVALERAERAGADLVSSDVLPQLFTAGQLGLAFGFVLPLFLGLAIYIVPLQVGAATIAFPRAAAASLWTWVLATGLLVTAYALDGGIAGRELNATNLGLLSLMVAVAALLLATVCVVTTVVGLRAEGLSMPRVPLFSWSMLVAGGVWLLTWPVMIGFLAVIWVDHDAGAVAFGQPDRHWVEIGWFLVLPQVYALAIPALGVIGDAVPTLSRVRQPSRAMVMGGIGVFGAFSLGAWAAPMQAGDIWAEPLFVLVSFAVIVPLLAVLAAWTGAVRRGSPRFAAPLTCGFVALGLLLLASVVGALFAVEPLRLQEAALAGAGVPAAALGHASLVVAAAAAGAVAALFFWGAKITGGAPPQGVGTLAALLLVVGGVLWGVPAVVEGLQGRISAVADVADVLAGISVAGALLVVAAVALAALGVLRATAARPRDAAPLQDDPWGCGQTLEWACPTPPPPANFAEVAVVRSPEPLLDAAGSDDADTDAEETT